MLKEIRIQIAANEPVSTESATWLWQNADNATLRELAGEVKSRFHEINSATYVMMAIVNYTNICVAKCDYCAFYRLPDSPEGYLLSFDQLRERIDKLVALGGSLVGFNGGFHPGLRIEDYATLFQRLRDHYGDQLEFYQMTVAEFLFASKVSKLSYDEAAQILRENGVHWITGGGSEILEPKFRRRHSPKKFSVDEYYKAQAAILKAGLGSTATMVIGFDETLEERLWHLERLRSFQDQVDGALTSFLCWTYKPYHTELGGEEISTEEYLRWLAICRIYLHNFRHIRTSVLTKNRDALLGIQYGANDFDLPTEDEVTQKAGAQIEEDFAAILSAADDLGLRVKKRKPFAVQEGRINPSDRISSKPSFIASSKSDSLSGK